MNWRKKIGKRYWSGTNFLLFSLSPSILVTHTTNKQIQLNRTILTSQSVPTSSDVLSITCKRPRHAPLPQRTPSARVFCPHTLASNCLQQSLRHSSPFAEILQDHHQLLWGGCVVMCCQVVKPEVDPVFGKLYLSLLVLGQNNWIDLQPNCSQAA